MNRILTILYFLKNGTLPPQLAHQIRAVTTALERIALRFAKSAYLLNSAMAGFEPH
jgi:hypothetical protein